MRLYERGDVRMKEQDLRELGYVFEEDVESESAFVTEIEYLER